VLCWLQPEGKAFISFETEEGPVPFGGVIRTIAMSKQEEVFFHVDVIPEQYRYLTTGGGVEMEKKGEKEKENRAVQKGEGKGTR